MKKMIIVFALYITSCFPQIDSTTLSFYPLSTGNYWQYKEIEFEGPYIFETNYFSITVTGDTLLTNGKYYKIMEKQYLNSSEINFVFERVDSLTGDVYRYYNEIYPDYNKDEYLIDSLKSQLGDSCAAHRVFEFSLTPLTIFWSEEKDSLFFQNRDVKYFIGRANCIPTYDYKLLKNIGLYKLTDWGEIRSTRIELIYANINGKEYGEKIQDGINEGPLKFKSFQLKQNCPNPFNSNTKIHYKLTGKGHVQIQIFNIYGQHVKTLYDREQNPGTYSTNWNGQNDYGETVSSGVYFCRLAFNEQNVETIRLVFLK